MTETKDVEVNNPHERLFLDFYNAQVSFTASGEEGSREKLPNTKNATLKFIDNCTGGTDYVRTINYSGNFYNVMKLRESYLRTIKLFGRAGRITKHEVTDGDTVIESYVTLVIVGTTADGIATCIQRKVALISPTELEVSIGLIDVDSDFCEVISRYL